MVIFKKGLDTVIILSGPGHAMFDSSTKKVQLFCSGVANIVSIIVIYPFPHTVICFFKL